MKMTKSLAKLSTRIHQQDSLSDAPNVGKHEFHAKTNNFDAENHNFYSEFQIAEIEHQ